MKRVLIYVHEKDLTPRGGPLGYNYNLKQGLDMHSGYGIEISYILSNNVKSSISKKVNSIRFKSIRNILMVLKSIVNKGKILYGLSHKSTVDLNEFDIVHFHQAIDLYSVRDSIKKYKGKIVLTSHTPTKPSKETRDNLSLFEKKYMKKFYSKLDDVDMYAFSKADYIIFPCVEAEEPYYNNWKEYEQIRIKNSDKYRYLLTGTTQLQPKLSVEDCRKKYGIPENAFVISYVGRHNEIKGYDRLKEFANNLFKKIPNLYVLVAGKEAPLKGLEHERWIEVGWTDDPASIINAGDCFVLPNKETFFDLVMLEVLSIGQIVLASNTGGNKHFKLYENSGIFIYDNFEEFEGLLKKLMGMSKNEMDKLRQQNKKICCENYSLKIFAKNYIELLKSL